jgi:hypothetical protein
MAKSAKQPKKIATVDKGGRPRKYDRDVFVPKICARLATGKEPMTVVCEKLGVPVRTVNDWRKADAEIAAQFDEARDLGIDAIAHDALVIADTPQLGVIEKSERVVDKHGRSRMVVTERRQEDMLGHRKLQVETRLKLLAKWDPRRYGDKMQHSNDPENPLPAPQFIIQPVRPAEGQGE